MPLRPRPKYLRTCGVNDIGDDGLGLVEIYTI